MDLVTHLEKSRKGHDAPDSESFETGEQEIVEERGIESWSSKRCSMWQDAPRLYGWS